MTDTISVQKLLDIFQNKRVLIVGDSIMRDVYRDLCCLLTNNSRLLQETELMYNRHNLRNNSLFGDQVHSFHINRMNSTFNIEKRVLQSDAFKYYVCYNFSSRIWNNQMNNLLLSMKHYNFIIVQSFIWDMSRYNDHDGSIYLMNLDLFLSKLHEMNKKIIWILLPPSGTNKADHINNALTKLSPIIIETVEKYKVNLLNLSTCLPNDIHIRHNDGIHFTPYGHRLITEKLADIMVQVPQGYSTADTDNVSSLNNNNNNVSTAPSYPSRRFNQGYRNFHPHHNRRKFDNNHQNKSETDSNQKRIKLDPADTDNFGRAFGLAWKTFTSL
ncbi:unnamed protein product [Adineta steineri]|uniref:Trichome birefringence-like C-terminal domain-containing protein n=2 Tax=Adineta steineri TaxID=433720 RepID=A0A815VAA6_9BILA|nr:unnamed protein product [Adineta steineri]